MAALGDAPRPDVAQRLLARLDRMDRASALRAVQYLARSAPNDAALKARLREILERPGSPLSGDPALRTTLQHLEQR